MKLLRIIAAASVAMVIIAGCSNKVYVQKDDTANFSSYHTYVWIKTLKDQKGDGKRATDYADISVHNAVNAELRKLGWREVSNDPDVLISYDVLVEKTTEQRSDPVYSQPFTRTYYNPFRRRWATVYYPSQFLGYDEYTAPAKQGTVTITMMDARTDRSVWQGWTTEQLDNSRITNDEISESVRNIFRKFDVAMK